ncbi:pepsin/retropepsin-like aspartic protease family protein [uncultured Sphingomonas sp.]|uniref:pepsin/retropepsin-like aspartic protease family protein n=1 Tax=uncultured Sphingomonas sp. TaxID=158754 RepID=UPI0035CAF49C
MEIVKGLILFQGRVNGRPATILLDNGTGRTVVDTIFARQAGIQIDERAGDALTGTARIATFRTGSTVLEVPHAFTMTGELISFDLRPISQALGRQVDAVLGVDATNVMAVMLQPDRNQLSLVSSGSIKLNGPDVVRLPLLTGNQVEAAINGHKVNLLVDFGYSGAVKLSDAAWKQIMGRSDVGAAEGNSITADGTVLNSRVAPGALSIGRISSGNAPIASGYVPVGASDGLLGAGFFLMGTSVVDGPARQVVLIVRREAQRSAPFRKRL